MKKILVLAAVFGFAAVLNVSAADAKANWDSICAKCHGADGKGDTKIGQKLGVKDFTDAKVQADMKDEDGRQGHQGRHEGCGWQDDDEGSFRARSCRTTKSRRWSPTSAV